MAVLLGRNARIKKNDVVIAQIRSGTLTVDDETIDISYLGVQWAKFAIGMRSWSASLTALFNKLSTEQNAMRAAAMNGTELTDISYWIDSTSNFDCDVITDPDASVIVASFDFSFDNGSVVEYNMSLTGNGPVRFNL